MTDENKAVSKLPEGYYLQLLVPEDTTDILDVWGGLKAGKTTIFTIILIFALIGALLAFFIPKKYDGEVVVASVGDVTTSKNSSGSSSSDTVDISVVISSDEALAILESKAFLYEFIAKENITPVLFADKWDADNKKWKDSEDVPTAWDAYDKFSDDILDVSTDETTGLTTITTKWTDPELAMNWANALVAQVNAKLRARAIQQAEKSLKYLRDELSKTSAVDLQQGLYALIEVQLAKAVAANVNEEYAFHVIDAATKPEEQSIPYFEWIIFGVFLFLGMITGISYVWFRFTMERLKARKFA